MLDMDTTDNIIIPDSHTHVDERLKNIWGGHRWVKLVMKTTGL